MSESNVLTDTDDDQPEGLTNWQAKEQFVKEKVANMHRFTNDVDIRRMPQSTFETAMADRSALALHAEQRKSTNRTKRMFLTNSIVSIHRDDRLLRVVLTESLPFMCAICGEAFAHTKPLQDHVQEKHGYFQNLVNENEPRKKPVIIDKNFGRKEDQRYTSMKGITQDQEEDALDTMDDSPPEVPSDSDWEGEGGSNEALEPDASPIEEGVEHILTQMANQEEVSIKKRAREEDMGEPSTNEASVPAKTTPGDIQVVLKKQKKKKKKKKKQREKYTVQNADQIKQRKDKRTKGKAVHLDENGEPRAVKTLKPFCVVCHLHCKTRVVYRAHLAEAHSIFASREDAEKAREKMKEKVKDCEVNGSDEQRDQASDEQQAQLQCSLENVESAVIKCDFCESYVLDENTLEKHMRAHCGNPGIKCDICREGIRLWENSMMEELKDLAERMLSRDRRPQDVDCHPGKSVPRKYPNSRVISTCYECNDQFYHSSHMGNHYSKAHVSITCKECNTVLPNMAALATHSFQKHRPGIFRCQWCPRRFHDRGKFNYHLAGHMGQYRCPGCGRNFVEKPSLMYHIKKYEKYPSHFQGRQTTAQEISVEKPFLTDGVTDHQNRLLTVMVCDLCNASFVNKGNYTRHMNTVHPGHEGQSMDNSYICDTCGNVFWSKNNLMTHMKIHNKKFPCLYPGCTKRFWAPGMMKKHFQTHEGHPTYYCEDCGKTFQNSGSLRFHKRTHTSRMSKCEICLQEFKGRSHLANHMQEAHNQELHFTCGVCQKQFASRQHLLSHAKVHNENLNDFVCEKCTCSFPEEHLLLRHMCIHTKTYKCNFCPTDFSSTDALKSHHLKEHAAPAQAAPTAVQDFNGEGIKIELQDGEGVVIVEYPAGDQEATHRAIAAIVSELQG